MTKLNVKVFADGADIEEMKSAYKNQLVDGLTHQFLLRCLPTIYLLWKRS